MSCPSKFSKIFLIIFNILFCLLGIGCEVVGVLVIVNRPVLTSLLSNIPRVGESLDALLTSTSHFQVLTSTILALGALIFLLAFIGCVGAIRESRCLLGVYIFCISLIIMIQVGAGVLAYIFKNQVIAYVRSFLQDTLSDKYQGISIVNGSLTESEEPYSAAWDIAMISMECCGNYNYSDFSHHARHWSRNYSYGSHELTSAVVPITCCKVTSKADLLNDLSNFQNYFTNSTQCLTTADPLYTNTDNCYDRMATLVNSYSLVVLGVGVGIATFELLFIIFASCLIHANRIKSADSDIVDAWKSSRYA